METKQGLLSERPQNYLSIIFLGNIPPLMYYSYEFHHSYLALVSKLSSKQNSHSNCNPTNNHSRTKHPVKKTRLASIDSNVSRRETYDHVS